MALSSTIVSTVRGLAGTAVSLPLKVAGKAVGTVTSHLPGRGAGQQQERQAPAAGETAPPAEAPTETSSPAATTTAATKPPAAKPPAAKKTPAKKTPAKKTPAKKAPAQETAATKTAPVEPSTEPVTEIDAKAETEKVDVTPADIAPQVGTELDPDTPTLAEVDAQEHHAEADADKATSGSGQ